MKAFLCDKLKLLTVLAAMPTVVSLFADWHYLLELATHFRAHYAAAFGVLVILFLGFRQWRWGLIAGIGLVANAAPIVPWYFGKPVVHDGIPLRILLSNVHTANTNPAPLLELLEKEKPDVVVLEEVDDRWLESLKSLAVTYPNARSMPRDDNFGIGVWSRIPIPDAVIIDSGPFDVPSIVATLNIPGQSVTLIATHPIPPANGPGARGRNQQLDEMAKLAKNAPHPTILIGDLNVTMWSPVYRRFEAASGLKNVRQGFGVLPSWPEPFAAVGIPLDHCMVSPSLGIRDVRVGPSVASDHLPLIVDLTIPRNK